jgi:hypothetical protein
MIDVIEEPTVDFLDEDAPQDRKGKPAKARSRAWDVLPQVALHVTGDLAGYDGSDGFSLQIARAEPEELEKLIELLEDHTAHAEARMRRLASSLAKPDLAELPLPEWFRSGVEELRSEGATVLEGALRSAALLVRAFSRMRDVSALSPRLSAGPRGSVEIQWGPGCGWTVYAPPVGWPLVHARVYGTVQSAPRTFRLAKSVLNHSETLLK